MELSHVTLRDETLVHQVRFSTLGSGPIQVSCVCRVLRSGMTQGSRPRYVPIGPSRNIEESRELYNNPENHYAPFGEEDRAKW